MDNLKQNDIFQPNKDNTTLPSNKKENKEKILRQFLLGYFADDSFSEKSISEANKKARDIINFIKMIDILNG